MPGDEPKINRCPSAGASVKYRSALNKDENIFLCTIKSSNIEGVPARAAARSDDRAFFEQMRWERGGTCPVCGSENPRRMPPRLYQCNGCRRQFSVTSGTIFEDSKVPLWKWLRAIRLMCAPGKGVTATELLSDPGFGSYRTAWILCHRIRWALRQEPMENMLRRAGELIPPPGRAPVRIRLTPDQAMKGLLAVRPQPRNRVKSERTIGAKIERRSRKKKAASGS